MIVPPGYHFRPSDEELLVFYLGRKIKGLPLPCDVFIERDIYGISDKAPWQMFSDEDPWEICKNGMKTEGTIYVFMNLIKASKNRIARIAGCGVWHAETAVEQVVDDYSHVLGYKRLLCFQITNESGLMDKSVTKGHWIMHEYSLSGGGDNTEYVLCRIKRDDSKSTKKSLGKRKNVGDVVIVPKPAKRIRTEFVQEQKMACDIAAAPATEGLHFSEEVLEVEKQEVYPPMHSISDMVDGDFEELESLISLLESKEQPSLGLDCDAYGNNSLTPEVIPSGHVLASSALVALDTSQDMVAGYFQEPVSLLGSEKQPSFDVDFDIFGYNPLTPEDTSQDYGEVFLTYLLEPDLPYEENLWSGEPNCFGVGLLI
ncbi:hypothetical protein Vadar_021174 [Vaccinium darrowii]|uniref:Uncharacterized protein n=1 Tax=Vaccinium darrowii TaxID=229202 RepID=A0ACB7Y9F1_9ERIC|nr:hypothetical protein Vadar_021174 [Vaccinium darrowii]